MLRSFTLFLLAAAIAGFAAPSAAQPAVVANRLDEAVGSGVKMLACENTMRNQKLGRDDMHARIGYVQSGVVELVRKQQQGWAYIRP